MTENKATGSSYLPICELCDHPMQLVDLRAKAEALGVRFPDNKEHFAIECCGHTLHISEPSLLKAAVANLKIIHGME